jgi:hypothetical protein
MKCVYNFRLKHFPFEEQLSEMCFGRHVPGYSWPILMKLEISRQTFENTQTSNFTKIRPEGAKLFRADRQTDIVIEANSSLS